MHYDLNLSYQPDRHQLAGVATLVARATQNLSRFDLDLQGLTVRRVTVDGLAASFTRKGQELIITPPFGLLAGTPFVVMVRYDGSPKTVEHSPRGFMTLALLRHKIGDAKFFTLLRTWTRTHRNSTGTTAQFVALAEQISGLKLESFFQAWLFQKKQPRWPG